MKENPEENNHLVELYSYILIVLVVGLGLLFLYWGNVEYNRFSPLIELKLANLGRFAVILGKILLAYFLWFIFGVLHIVIIIKLMEILRSILNK